MLALGGAEYVGTSSMGEVQLLPDVELDPQYVGSRIGLEVATEVVKEKLELVGCTLKVSGSLLRVSPPSWRVELLTQADLTEEVARNIGYDKIPSILPPRRTAAELSPAQKRRRSWLNHLVARGYTEVMTFPFTNEDVVAKMGFVGARAASYRIANPMSEDAPLMRPHLLPAFLKRRREIMVGALRISRFSKWDSFFERALIYSREFSLKQEFVHLKISSRIFFNQSQLSCRSSAEYRLGALKLKVGKVSHARTSGRMPWEK